MSLSKPTTSSNPATKFIEYKGDSGKWFYYDKAKGEKVEVERPFYFMVLDQLSTIKGYNDEHGCGIYSNEIQHINKPLTVKTFEGGICIKGLYQDIKYEVKGIGGKYTKSIYAMLIKDDVEPELVNFQLSGAAFSTWLDLKLKEGEYSFKIIGVEKKLGEGKKGAVKYFTPTFKRYEVKEGLLDTAIEMDKKLQEYLDKYKQTNEVEVEEKPAEDAYDKVKDEFEPENKVEDKETQFTSPSGVSEHEGIKTKAEIAQKKTEDDDLQF